MKTNVSGTSIHSYHTEIKGGKETSQDSIILDVIKEHGPCTARMIQEKTKMEINCVSRSLNNLWSGNNGREILVTVSKIDFCPITGRKVKFYLCAKREKNLN